MSALGDLGGDLAQAVEDVNVPSYCIDASGVIRWLNPAAERLVGDARGRQFTSVVAPADVRRARDHLARKVAGTERVLDARVDVLDPGGRPVSVEISSVTLTDGNRMVGIFGQVADVETAPDRPALPSLTPRQTEILRLLEHGKSTEQIARELHLTPETVKNHVKRLLRAMGVHSRLEAVAHARHGPRGE